MSIYDTIETSFKKPDELYKKINNSNFFFNYMNIINAENFKIVPNLKKNQKISYPVDIEYIDNPTISGTTIKIPKLLIKQRWNLDKKLTCHINIFLKLIKIGSLYLEFNFEEKKNMILKIKAYWTYKSIIIPDDLLKNIVNETKLIIANILKNYN